uniref:hypothetical protein n=1 Tax=Rhizobium sp. F40D2 TaxID=3453141 RepID=UPI003F252B1E
MTTQQRRAGQFWSMAALAAILLVVTAVAGGYRINLIFEREHWPVATIPALHQPAAVDDLLVHPARRKAGMVKARARGYLRSGSCPGKAASQLMIKTVITVAGQHVEIGASVRA